MVEASAKGRGSEAPGNRSPRVTSSHPGRTLTCIVLWSATEGGCSDVEYCRAKLLAITHKHRKLVTTTPIGGVQGGIVLCLAVCGNCRTQWGGCTAFRVYLGAIITLFADFKHMRRTPKTLKKEYIDQFQSWLAVLVGSAGCLVLVIKQVCHFTRVAL